MTTDNRQPTTDNYSPPKPRKGLGQHFLRDRTVPPRIAEAADVEPDDCIVEVGPGLGVLTEELARRLDPTRGRLVAVELDGALLPILRERFAGYPNVSFLHADVLEVPPQELVGEQPYKLVANLPYYITSAILRHFLETTHRPRSLTVMVQREVAERMASQPPDMSLLAVSVQFYGKPKIMFRVPPGAFNPPPKVDSAVVRIDVYGEGTRPVEVESDAVFFRVVQAGFSQRRKQLANTLSSGLGITKEKAIAALNIADVDPSRRAETVTLAEWGKLERALGAQVEMPEAV